MSEPTRSPALRQRPRAGSAAGGSRAAVLDPPLEAETRPADGPMQVWMHRISVFLFVLISAVAGVLLIILPWTPEWTDNYLLLSFPALRSVVSNGFFRGHLQRPRPARYLDRFLGGAALPRTTIKLF